MIRWESIKAQMNILFSLRIYLNRFCHLHSTLRDAILLSLKPCPTNHILKLALLISASVGPFFLNNPTLKIDGNFRSSFLPKESLPKSPINKPTIIYLKMPSQDLALIFTPK